MIDSTRIVGTISANGGTVSLGVAGYAGLGIQINATFVGTLAFEGTLDNTTWHALTMVPTGSTSAVTSTTTAGAWQGSCAGLLVVRVRATAWTSGGAPIMIQATGTGGASGGGGGASGGTSSDFGAAFPVAGTAAGFKDSTGATMEPGNLDASGNLKVNVAAGSASGPTADEDGNVPAGDADVPITIPLSYVYNGTSWSRVQAVLLDYDTGGGTVSQIAYGIALPGAGGPVAGGTATNPIQVGDAGGSLTVDGPLTDAELRATPVPVTPAANSAVNVAQVGGNNAVTAGVNGTLAVGGNVATNVAIGTNPLNNGAQAVSSENAAVTTGRMVQLVADLVGKLIVLPYANPENFVSGAIVSAMTGTTSTSLVAAPAAGLRNYITQITVSNASTTVPTDILIQDGNGGTTLYVVPAPVGTGTGTGTSGGTYVFPTPLRQPTTATALYVANVTTGSSTKVSASGYRGA